MRTITLDDGCGLVLRGNDVAGTPLWFSDLSGWYEGADVRLEHVDRITDGSFPTMMWRQHRTMTLSGFAKCGTTTEVASLARRLSASFQSGRVGNGTIVVDGEGELLSALGVGLDGRPKVSHNLVSKMVEFQLPLFSPDPYLYGEPQRGQIGTFSGQGLIYPLFDDESGTTTGVLEFGASRAQSVTVTNTGNAPAYPRFTVSGSFPAGFVLDVGGRQLTYEGEVTSRASVDIDMRGTVTSAGVDRSYLLATRQWAAVQPGASITPTIRPISAGDGVATVELRPTYL